jgi:hypothetical protein
MTGHSSIRTTVDLYAHLATEDVAADLARVIAARESRLRDQSAAQTRTTMRKEAPSGFEPLYEALQSPPGFMPVHLHAPPWQSFPCKQA